MTVAEDENIQRVHELPNARDDERSVILAVRSQSRGPAGRRQNHRVAIVAFAVFRTFMPSRSTRTLRMMQLKMKPEESESLKDHQSRPTAEDHQRKLIIEEHKHLQISMIQILECGSQGQHRVRDHSSHGKTAGQRAPRSRQTRTQR